MVDVLLAAALAAAAPQARAAAARRRRARDVRGPRRRHHHLHFRHLPRARRPSEWFSDTRQDGLRCIRRAGARDPDPRGSPGPGRAAPGFSMAPAPVVTLSVAPSASFLATTRMAINAGRSQGMQVGNGADMVLRHAAELEGKPVEGLETLEFAAQHVQPHAAGAGRAASRVPARRPSNAAAMDSPVRRPWPKCSRRGSAATRACSCACSISSTARRPTPIG